MRESRVSPARRRRAHSDRRVRGLGSGLPGTTIDEEERWRHETVLHAACFSMALSNILAEAGHAPESMQTTAKVHLRFVEEAPSITETDLITEGRVPGIDQDQFADYAAQAKAGCPVSRALAGVGEITLDATLAS